MKRIRLLLGASLVVAACTPPGAALLTIDATGPNGRLAIPADIDTIVVSAVEAGGRPALEPVTYPLTGAFPVSLGVNPGPHTGTAVRFSVIGKRGDEEVAGSAAEVKLESQRVTEITLQLVVD